MRVTVRAWLPPALMLLVVCIGWMFISAAWLSPLPAMFGGQIVGGVAMLLCIYWYHIRSEA